MGANKNLLRPYGLSSIEGAELTRVALTAHQTPVTCIVAVALRMLRKQSPGLQLVVSFADPAQGHIGAIYQGGGWVYIGKTQQEKKYAAPDGKIWHRRMVSVSGFKPSFGRRRAVWRMQDCQVIPVPGKHRYLMPLDDEMRRRVEPLRKPYPKRPKSIDSDATADQAEERGAGPTLGLQ